MYFNDTGEGKTMAEALAQVTERLSAQAAEVRSDEVTSAIQHIGFVRLVDGRWRALGTLQLVTRYSAAAGREARCGHHA